MSEILSIYEIADLNKNTITAKDNFSFINYLDTSNLTKNKVDSLQFLESEFPSRAKRKVTINTILYSTVRPNQEHFGIIENQIADNLIASTGFTTIDIVSSNINVKYLYYKLTQPFVTNYLQGIAENSVSAYPSIKPEAIGNLRFSFPDLSTQQKIASLLSTIDDKIELNNRINDNLEQMAKTLYDYWFLQFDFPDENGRPYKSSGGKMVWNEVLKREIPISWEVRKISQIAKTGSGGTPKSTEKDYYENGDVPWINSGELNNSFIISTNNYITELGMKNSNAKLFPRDTILMAMYGATAGKTSILSFEATTNQAICAVMPLETEMFHYTKFVLDDLYKYLINLSTGSARDNLSQDKIRELNIIVPNNFVLNQHSKMTFKYFEKIRNNLQQNQQLNSLRDWLLPMLMNGQVKVE